MRLGTEMPVGSVLAMKKQTETMKTLKIMEQHTVALSDGEAVIHTVSVTSKRVPYKSDDELKGLLIKLSKLQPWDNWGHVIATLKTRRTYIIQNGASVSLKFSQ